MQKSEKEKLVQKLRRAADAQRRAYPGNIYHDGEAQGLDMAAGIIGKIRCEEEQHWIPCSERLPDDGKWSLFTDGENMSVERYKLDAIDHFFPNGRWFDIDEAVAWMPLPEPYREEKNNAELIDRQAAIEAIVGKEATVDPEVKCLFCGHHVAERPFEVYCNIMCKWVNEKDYCTMFEPHPVFPNCGTKMEEAKH